MKSATVLTFVCLLCLRLPSSNAAPVLQGSAREIDFSTEQLKLEGLGIELLPPAANVYDDSVDQLQGEDLGQSSVADAVLLGRVVQLMRDAEQYLQDRSSSVPASAAQTQALSTLDIMLEQLAARQSQCAGGQCQKPAAPKPGSKHSEQAKSGAKPGEAGAQVKSGQVETPLWQGVAEKMVKDLWGSLPQRQREQILQPLREDFLPEYAAEIEQYFRALADPATAEENSQ